MMCVNTRAINSSTYPIQVIKVVIYLRLSCYLLFFEARPANAVVAFIVESPGSSLGTLQNTSPSLSPTG